MIKVIPGGTGDESDAVLVRAELARFPAAELEMLAGKGVDVIACHEAVTDHRPDLLAEPPRNWPPGANWSIVPGCYAPDEGNVIIATVVDPAGGRRVPPQGVKHGAYNLVVHEVMHADDYVADRLRSHNAAFVAARAADLDALSDYERREGDAGFEETYAESAARFWGGDPHMAARLPNLHAFWSGWTGPVERGRRSRRRGRARPEPIGTAERLADGSIALDLRADNEAGFIGHALVTLEPGTEAHDQVDRRFRSARRRRGAAASNLIVLDAF